MHPWTPEKIEELRKAWGEGKSASVIARELGIGSRSAVIGKAFRLQLPRRQTSIRSKMRPKKFTPSKFNAPPPPKAAAKRVYVLAKDDRVPRPVEITPEHERKTLMELGDHDCRFPFGEGAQITFCGRKSVPSLSYCASHAQTCFTQVGVNLAEVIREPAKNPEPENMGKSHVLEGAL